MVEKRFKMVEDNNGLYSIFDNEDKEDEPLIYGAKFGTEKICDLLNEQQATIDQLNLAIDDLLSHTSCDEIKKENEKLRKLERQFDEQIATITKLRNENIILKNKIEDLRVSLFMQDKELQRQMQKSDLDE